MIPKKTILESDPPVILASTFALKEGNSKKPIYTMHKWWARRLGSVIRLLLLGPPTPRAVALGFRTEPSLKSTTLGASECSTRS